MKNLAGRALRSVVFFAACFVAGFAGSGIAEILADLTGQRLVYGYGWVPMILLFAWICATLAASTRLRPDRTEMAAGAALYVARGLIWNAGTLVGMAIGAAICLAIALFVAWRIDAAPPLPKQAENAPKPEPAPSRPAAAAIAGPAASKPKPARALRRELTPKTMAAENPEPPSPAPLRDELRSRPMPAAPPPTMEDRIRQRLSALAAGAGQPEG
jgi:MFS family permease